MDLSKAEPKARPIYDEFHSDEQGQIELVIQVCNSTYRKGGIWDVVKFGPAFHIFREFCFFKRIINQNGKTRKSLFIFDGIKLKVLCF